MLKKIMATGLTIVGVLVGGSVASAEYDPNSIVDYLRSKGQDHSFNHRANLAQQNGIEGYRGTATQNIQLLNILKRGPVTVAQTASINPQPVAETNQSKNVVESSGVQGKKMTVTATAYTAYCDGCSGVTATGINLRANPNQKVIAVDPNVIPLGSKVYVEGYGTAIAGDVGGAIKKSRIDVFIPDKKKALEWGRRTVEITIIE